MISNAPSLWRHMLPAPAADGHKYLRGHAVILGGTQLTGAARLASEATMRAGAGLCTIITASQSVPVYQAAAPHILVEAYSSLATFAASSEADTRRTAFLLGPGAGHNEAQALQQAVITTLALRRATVLDADALTVFATEPATLVKSLHPACVLTPHEGEFIRLFGPLKGSRDEAVQTASRQCGCTILLKGANTLIAAPDGTLACNRHASPWLATAGSGDVLAGSALGLLAQGMPPYNAACAAAWIHGEAALQAGPYLVAPDLLTRIPTAFIKALAHD